MELVFLLVICGAILLWAIATFINAEQTNQEDAEIETSSRAATGASATSAFSSISSGSYKREAYTPTYKKPKLNNQLLDVEHLSLGQEQKAVFNVLEHGREHAFVTGRAGTGKSVLLRYFISKTKKEAVVVAPTGVAALNIGGQTIHSLFWLPPGLIELDELAPPSSKVKTLLSKIDAVVIDEVSMVRSDLMEGVNYRLQEANGNKEPFGGKQIIMFGDPYQLPPVVSDRALQRYFDHQHGGPFFFSAPIWSATSMNIYELQHVYRQKDGAFRALLDAIRKGNASAGILDELNKRTTATPPEDGIVTLAGNNAKVSDINHRKLERLPGEAYVYEATVSGNIKEGEFPTEKRLKLKKGAQVILLSNDIEKRWANGTLGIVTSLDEDSVKVDIDGVSHNISKHIWNKNKYYYDPVEGRIEKETISSFTQLPLRLAWALTIHKSQGQTYGSVIVDITEGAFAHGQAYVAFSRCTSLEGLYLKAPVKTSDIIIDQAIVEFMKQSNAEGGAKT